MASISTELKTKEAPQWALPKSFQWSENREMVEVASVGLFFTGPAPIWPVT